MPLDVRKPANFRSFLAEVDVSAVAADPGLFALAVEDFAFLDVLAQSFVALLVLLLDGGYAFEEVGNVVEAFFSGLFGEGGVHVGPLIVFAGSRVLEVVYSLADRR